MKISTKKKIKEVLFYILSATIISEVIILIPTFGNYNLAPNERINFLIAIPIACGPSLGYCAYKIRKNNDRIQEDLDFRRYIILRTTFETCLILFPIWGILKLIGLL